MNTFFYKITVSLELGSDWWLDTAHVRSCKKTNLQLYQSRYITETVQASDKLTTCEDKVICGPSNGAISNDLEWLLTQVQGHGSDGTFQRRIFQKRCVLETTLLWDAKNDRQAIEWYQFLWPWVTHDPDFAVTVFFGNKYVKNGAS